jgi:hypothetical protein
LNLKGRDELMRRFSLFMLLMILGVGVGSVSAHGVRALVTSDVANVRVIPNFGGTPLGQVPAGYTYFPNARDATSQWYRFDFNGSEGWLHHSTSTIMEGDVAALPVADPRSIPYGGFESPRSGLTDNTSGPVATVRDWLRVRAGPSTGYAIIANAPINSQVHLLGRTAASNWIQINFSGTLGWVAVEWVIFPADFQISQLPIDGIVAQAPPPGDGGQDYIDVLLLMRDRIEFARPSLVAIRTAWTDAALTGRASCAPYPARPSDIQIPNRLLAVYYERLEPLRVRFNDAMHNIRYAIDLFIDVCNQVGTVNPVGQATVQGALETVSLAERQLDDLRRQLEELIPEPSQPGPDDCLFTFGGAVDILKVIPRGELVIDTITSRRFARGYCFDAHAEDRLAFELLQRPGSNGLLLLTISPLDNPTQFIGVGRMAIPEDLLRVSTVVIPQTGRYLITVSNVGEPAGGGWLQSEYGLYFHVPEAPSLSLDPVTGEIIAPTFIPVPENIIIIPPAFGFGTGNTSPLPDSVVIPPVALPTADPSISVCPSITATCNQLSTCGQAAACYGLGNFALDHNGDGIPCGPGDEAEPGVPIVTALCVGP